RDAVRAFAKYRPAIAIDELAALRPEHRQVIEHGRFPAAGVVHVAGDMALAGDAAADVEQRVPGGWRHRHEILAIEEHAAVGLVPHAEYVSSGIGQGLDGEG